MCPALEIRPAPSIAFGLGAGDLFRVRTTSSGFIGLAIGAVRCAGPHGGRPVRPAPRALAPISFDNSTRAQRENLRDNRRPTKRAPQF